MTELTPYPRAASQREEAAGAEEEADIRVRNVEQDRPIGYGSSAGRYFITVAFGIFYVPLLLDYLWPLWDKQHQAFHDKVASSIVVRV